MTVNEALMKIYELSIQGYGNYQIDINEIIVHKKTDNNFFNPDGSDNDWFEII